MVERVSARNVRSAVEQHRLHIAALISDLQGQIHGRPGPRQTATVAWEKTGRWAREAEKSDALERRQQERRRQEAVATVAVDEAALADLPLLSMAAATKMFQQKKGPAVASVFPNRREEGREIGDYLKERIAISEPTLAAEEEEAIKKKKVEENSTVDLSEDARKRLEPFNQDQVLDIRQEATVKHIGGAINALHGAQQEDRRPHDRQPACGHHVPQDAIPRLLKASSANSEAQRRRASVSDEEPTGKGAAAPTRGDVFLHRLLSQKPISGQPKKKEKKNKGAEPKRVVDSGIASCYGCGAPLQTQEVDAPGYVDLQTYEVKKRHHQLRTVLCGRCKLLSHGHMVTAVGGNGGYAGGKQFITAEELREKLRHLKTEKVLIVKLVDIVDFNGSFLARIRDIAGANPIILVITKVDLLPKGTDLNCVGDWIVEATMKKKLNVLSIHLTSSKSLLGIEGVAVEIQKEKKGRDVYILGSANVGKSAFVNALLQMMARKDPVAAAARKYKPMQSAVPGTTLGPIEIDAFHGGGKLYDTPGVHLHHRQAAVVHSEDLPSLAPQSHLRGQCFPASFDKEANSDGGATTLNGSSIFWGGLVRIDILKVFPHTRLTLYGPKALHSHMVPTVDADDFYKKRTHELEMEFDSIRGDSLLSSSEAKISVIQSKLSCSYSKVEIAETQPFHSSMLACPTMAHALMHVMAHADDGTVVFQSGGTKDKMIPYKYLVILKSGWDRKDTRDYFPAEALMVEAGSVPEHEFEDMAYEETIRQEEREFVKDLEQFSRSETTPYVDHTLWLSHPQVTIPLGRLAEIQRMKNHPSKCTDLITCKKGNSGIQGGTDQWVNSQTFKGDEGSDRCRATFLFTYIVISCIISAVAVTTYIWVMQHKLAGMDSSHPSATPTPPLMPITLTFLLKVGVISAIKRVLVHVVDNLATASECSFIRMLRSIKLIRELQS